MRIDNVCAEGCTAAWCPPEDDGGSPVQYYIVERVQVSMLLQYDQITIFRDLFPIFEENCLRLSIYPKCHYVQGNSDGWVPCGRATAPECEVKIHYMMV